MIFKKLQGNIKIAHATLAVSLTSAIPLSAIASTCSNGSSGLCNPLKVNSIQELLTAILGYLVQVGTVIIVLMMVYVGFKFVLARGNPTELQNAKKMLLWTIIGALVILGAQAISMGIQSTVTAISS